MSETPNEMSQSLVTYEPTSESLVVNPKNESLVVVGETDPRLIALESALKKRAENEQLTTEEAIMADTAEIIAEAAFDNNKEEGVTAMNSGTLVSDGKVESKIFVANGDMNMEQIKKASDIPTTDGRSFIYDKKPFETNQPIAEIIEKPAEVVPDMVEQAADIAADTAPEIVEQEIEKPLSEMDMAELNGQLVKSSKIENPAMRNEVENEIFQAMSNVFEGGSSSTKEAVAKPQESSETSPSDHTPENKTNTTTGKLENGWEYEVSTNIAENGTTPEKDTGTSYKDMSLDELTTLWANAMDDKDDETSRDINSAIRERLREKNISGNDKPFEEYSHQDALMARIYETVEAKRKNQESIETGEDDKDKIKVEAETETETGEDDKDKIKAESEEKRKIIIGDIQAARSIDVAETLLTTAMKINAEKQESAKLKNSHNIIKALFSRVKNLTLFKANVETLQAKNLLDMCREKSKNGNLTFEDWKEVLRANGIEPIPEQEAAFLGILASNMEGLIENQVDAPPEIKDAVIASCTSFAAAIAASGLKPEDIASLKAAHKAEISQIFKSSPNTNPRDLELYADNAAEVLNNILAAFEHEQGMAEIDKQLAGMKVTMGELRYGPYNNIDTTMLEKVDRLGKLHNTTNVILKAGFVVGSWIAVGGLTAAAVQYSKSGATMATSAALGSLAGPLGTLVGIGVGAIGAGLYARHLGRRRENEKAERFSSDVRETKIGFDKKGRKLIEPFLDKDGNIRSDLSPEQIAQVEAIKENHSKETTAEKLKPKQISMPDQISNFMRYMKPKDTLPKDADGKLLEYNKNDPRNYELRSDLKPEEQIAMAKDATRLRTMIDFQSKYNETASDVASKAHGRSGIRKSLSSTLDTEGLALNLFQATTQESYLPELYTMGTLLSYVETEISKPEFQELKEQTQGANGEVMMTPITEVMGAIAAGVDYDCENNVAEYWDSVRKDVNRVGRKSGAVGFGLALAIGLASKGGNILDDMKSGNVIGNPTVKDLPIVKNTNGTYSVDTPAGTHNFSLDPTTGKMYQADLDTLDKLGIQMDQKVSTANAVESVSDYIKNKLGGKKVDIDWIAKTRTPSGTELSLHEEILPNGDHLFWSQGGIATNGAETYDILNSECVLRLSDTADTTAVIGAFQRVGNRLVTTLHAGDPAIAALKSADVGMSIIKNGVHKSIVTVPNPDGTVMSTVLNTELGAKLTEAGEIIAKKISGWFSGLVTTATDSGEGGVKDGTAKQSAGLQTDGDGQAPTPQYKPPVSVTSTLKPIPEPTTTQTSGQAKKPEVGDQIIKSDGRIDYVRVGQLSDTELQSMDEKTFREVYTHAGVNLMKGIDPNNLGSITSSQAEEWQLQSRLHKEADRRMQAYREQSEIETPIDLDEETKDDNNTNQDDTGTGAGTDSSYETEAGNQNPEKAKTDFELLEEEYNSLLETQEISWRLVEAETDAMKREELVELSESLGQQAQEIKNRMDTGKTARPQKIDISDIVGETPFKATGLETEQVAVNSAKAETIKTNNPEVADPNAEVSTEELFNRFMNALKDDSPGSKERFEAAKTDFYEHNKATPELGTEPSKIESQDYSKTPETAAAEPQKRLDLDKPKTRLKQALEENNRLTNELLASRDLETENPQKFMEIQRDKEQASKEIQLINKEIASQESRLATMPMSNLNKLLEIMLEENRKAPIPETIQSIVNAIDQRGKSSTSEADKQNEKQRNDKQWTIKQQFDNEKPTFRRSGAGNIYIQAKKGFGNKGFNILRETLTDERGDEIVGSAETMGDAISIAEKALTKKAQEVEKSRLDLIGLDEPDNLDNPYARFSDDDLKRILSRAKFQHFNLGENSSNDEKISAKAKIDRIMKEVARRSMR